jgi:multicomponent Na+:H+ antiporter subunit E
VPDRDPDGIGRPMRGYAAGQRVVGSTSRRRGMRQGSTRRALLVRYAGAVLWCYLVWNLLTWTASAENMGIGFGVAMLVALAVASAGEVVPPWRLLDPRRWWGLVRLVGVVAWGVARENVKLAYRIWAPARPIRSGMVTAPTLARTDGELATVGLTTSLIVDNQIIDLDRSTHRLQFHGVALPERGDDNARSAINGPVERPLLSITRR